MKLINPPFASRWLRNRVLISTLLVVAACSTDNFDPLGQPETVHMPIRFQTSAAHAPFGTRAAGVTLDEANPLLSVGVYAAYTDGNWQNDAPLNLLMNQEVKRADVSSSWGYTPQQFWPGSGRISFFAYAPYGDNRQGITLTALKGKPRIDFSVSTDLMQQIDLLVARPVLNQAKPSGTAVVTLSLVHALTKIGFSARLSSPPAADTEVRVTKIALTRLYAKGTLPMDGNEKQWSNLTDDSQPFALHFDKDVKPLTDVYASLSAEDKYLFLLPQPIHDEARITIAYDIITPTDTQSKTMEMNLASAIGQFTCGEAYNFLFTIDSDVSFVVTSFGGELVDWEDDYVWVGK